MSWPRAEILRGGAPSAGQRVDQRGKRNRHHQIDEVVLAHRQRGDDRRNQPEGARRPRRPAQRARVPVDEQCPADVQGGHAVARVRDGGDVDETLWGPRQTGDPVGKARAEQRARSHDRVDMIERVPDRRRQENRPQQPALALAPIRPSALDLPAPLEHQHRRHHHRKKQIDEAEQRQQRGVAGGQAPDDEARLTEPGVQPQHDRIPGPAVQRNRGDRGRAPWPSRRPGASPPGETRPAAHCRVPRRPPARRWPTGWPGPPPPARSARTGRRGTRKVEARPGVPARTRQRRPGTAAALAGAGRSPAGTRSTRTATSPGSD